MYRNKVRLRSEKQYNIYQCTFNVGEKTCYIEHFVLSLFVRFSNVIPAGLDRKYTDILISDFQTIPSTLFVSCIVLYKIHIDGLSCFAIINVTSIRYNMINVN